MAAAKPVIVRATVPAAAICAHRNRHLLSSIWVVIPEITDMATKSSPQGKETAGKEGSIDHGNGNLHCGQDAEHQSGDYSLTSEILLQLSLGAHRHVDWRQVSADG